LDEGFVRLPGRFRDQFGDADGFAVIEGDEGEVGLIAKEAVFGAVMQAVDLLSDQALEFPANFKQFWFIRVARGALLLQKVGNRLGGDAVWVVPFREDATD